MFSVFQGRISFFSVLVVLFFQHCLFGQSPDAVPQDYGDEYRKMVKEYKGIAKEHADVLDAKMANDPAFRRAKNWLENEQLTTESSPALQEDGEFFATLKEEDKGRYRDWQRGFTVKVGLEVFENEWNKYPASHKALLLWGASIVEPIEGQRLSEADSETVVEADKTDSHEALLLWADEVMKQIASKSQRSGSDDSDLGTIRGIEDDSRWQKFVDYARDSNADLLKQVPLLAQSLDIKPEMIRRFEKMVVNTTLFDVYDTYYRLYYPSELKSLEKEQTRLNNQLAEINHNWWYDEGIESPSLFDSIAPAVRSPFSLILLGLGAILVVYALVRVYQRKNKK